MGNFFGKTLEDIKNFWQYDPNARIKAIFMACAVVALSLLLVLLYLANTGFFDQQPGGSQNSAQESVSAPVVEDLGGSSSRVVRISGDINVGSSFDDLYIDGGERVFLNSDLRVVWNGNVVDSLAFNPYSMYTYQDNLVINSLNVSHVYNRKNNEVKAAPDNINHIVPINDKFWFVTPEVRNYPIKRASSLSCTKLIPLPTSLYGKIRTERAGLKSGS
jgi:hypothetical protein